MEYYDRYKNFRKDGKILKMPFAEIETSSNDIFIVFDKNTMRLDTLSYKYYGDANYAWLIMQANPYYGSMEFLIPNNVRLRIPYPLTDAINRYEKSINNYNIENN